MVRILLSVMLLFSTSLASVTDTVKTYRLQQVTVEASKQNEAKIIHNIEYRQIERTDASTVSDLGRLIPSVKVQTNSRGETLFYLRGAGERQITLFFDGVPLNTPWDNRVDLSMLPAEIIGTISVTKGVPSVTYGANAVSGVISLSSLSPPEGKSFGKVTTQFAEYNGQRYSASYFKGAKKYSYGFAAGYRKAGDFGLPNNYDNASNPGPARINSYSESFDVFGKINYEYSDNGNIGLSTLYSNSEKGVPPETDVANPRYWQYPVFDRLMFSLNGNYIFNRTSNSRLSYNIGANTITSQIYQYKDASFTTIDDIEKGDDFTASGNFLYSGILSASSLIKVSLNGYSTTHKERIQSNGFADAIYTQNVFSIGAEYEYFINDVALVVGGGYDFSNTPQTGDKEPQKALQDYSISGGLVYDITDVSSFHLSFGRKTRFPTLREAYSGALGRFVPNPGLKAEVAYSAEAGFSTLFTGGKADLNLFLTFLNDGIVRKSLPGRQFQRVNEDNIRIAGAEFSLNYMLPGNLNAALNVSYINAFAKDDAGNFKDTLEYKPLLNSSFMLQYLFPGNIESQIEANYTAKEFAYQEGNLFLQRLPDYMIINFRIAYRFNIFNNMKLELFGRINNLFDKLYFPQWGLPAPGRQMIGGMAVEF